MLNEKKRVGFMDVTHYVPHGVEWQPPLLIEPEPSIGQTPPSDIFPSQVSGVFAIPDSGILNVCHSRLI